jgi:hypothetical protein
MVMKRHAMKLFKKSNGDAALSEDSLGKVIAIIGRKRLTLLKYLSDEAFYASLSCFIALSLSSLNEFVPNIHTTAQDFLTHM